MGPGPVVEAVPTVKVLSSMNDAERDHRPDEKSRSAWELAKHIATADMWFIDAITKGQFVFDQEKAKEADSSFKSVADVVAFYQGTIPGMLKELSDRSGEFFAEPVDFFGAMQMSRAQWIGYANNHSVHHRGQLSAYLRSMGCKVPDIYGPSGDSKNA